MNATQATLPVPAIGRQPGQARRAMTGKVAALLVFGCLSTGASAFERPADGVYADRVDWGIMMDMSGPTAASQVPWTNGFQDYMRKVNEAGGIHGRKVNLLVEDDRYDAARDRINYEKLASQTPVIAISGVGNSSAQVALMSTIKAGKVPIVGTYATAKAGVEPANPMFYGGFCGFKEMAQVGVGFFTERLKLKAPRIAVVHLDVASGAEYFGYVQNAIAGTGGTAKSIPIKVTAADANAQVREIDAMKPDFVTHHGTINTALLLMRAMQQYGLKIPTFAITYLGTPGVYAALNAETGSNYYFVSCFTPGTIEEPGTKEMAAAAAKNGRSALKDDINYVAGWVIGQLAAEALTRVGPEPTREKLVNMLNKGFEVDTKGLSSPIKYTPDNHLGLSVLRPYGYDYQTKTYKAFGNYSDYQKYLK